jgi:DNA polymerase III epsilon subunit-like protein
MCANFLAGKNVLLVDCETTGLITPYCKHPAAIDYPPIKNNKAYDGARIVSIAWTTISTADWSPDTMKTNYKLRKIESFVHGAEKIHGLTEEMLNTVGVTFEELLTVHGLEDAISQADTVVAHNALFDILILANECHRAARPQLAAKLNNIARSGQYFCTLTAARKMYPSTYNLNLYSFYEKLHNGKKSEFIAHNAHEDLMCMAKCLKLILASDRV